VQQIEALVSSGLSFCLACSSQGIPYLYYCQWKMLMQKEDDINASNNFVSYNTKVTAYKICQGHTSVLAEI
jgi:hypothetical protein